MDRKRKSFGFSGFKVASRSEESPSSSSSSRRHRPTSGCHNHEADADVGAPAHYSSTRKWYMDDDESLEDDGEKNEVSSKQQSVADADEDDPLDSFMANIEAQAKKDKEASQRKAVVEKKPPERKKNALGRTDIEDEDDQESYFKWVEENKEKLERGAEDEEEEIEYDEEGNPIVSHKKHIDPLTPIDHSTIDYEPFEKNFYREHSDISQLSQEQVNALRKTLDVRVIGVNPPKPVSSFAHFGFDEKLMSAIRRAEYSVPTPIQAQGIPIILSGRDIIGIAKTGSGKTVAYLWPAIVHIMNQRELLDGEGPICLILVPARELAIQIYNEAKKFGKAFDLRVVCAYGGGSKWEQSKALELGSDIVIGTPGRVIDMVNMEAMDLRRVTYLVLDEADRMFDMGFEPQVRSIANHVRPDRQCMLFSATFKKKIESLARDVLADPIKVIQGELGEANEDIEQEVIVLPAGPAKYEWLLERLVGFCARGKVLIFVNQKQHVEELANNLKAKDFSVCLLHGDLLQHERNEVNQAFRKNVPILVATDVAARGLDILAIKTVINYDAAKDLDTHIHRIGRTGRAGEKGWAYTLLSEKDKEFAGHLVKNLNSLNQEVPPKLLELALQNTWFRNSFHGKVKPNRPGIGGRGLGYKSHGESRTGGVSYGSVSASASSFTVSQTTVPKTDDASPTNRLAAMKAALSSHYKLKFKPASAETSWDSQRQAFTDPTPEWKKKVQAFKETVEHQNQSEASPEFRVPLPAGSASTPDSSSSKSGARKKSRWE